MSRACASHRAGATILVPVMGVMVEATLMRPGMLCKLMPALHDLPPAQAAVGLNTCLSLQLNAWTMTSKSNDGTQCLLVTMSENRYVYTSPTATTLNLLKILSAWQGRPCWVTEGCRHSLACHTPPVASRCPSCLFLLQPYTLLCNSKRYFPMQR